MLYFRSPRRFDENGTRVMKLPKAINVTGELFTFLVGCFSPLLNQSFHYAPFWILISPGVRFLPPVPDPFSFFFFLPPTPSKETLFESPPFVGGGCAAALAASSSACFFSASRFFFRANIVAD